MRAWRRGLGTTDACGVVVAAGGAYALLAAADAAGAAAGRSVVITDGFHGDEKAGPLTLLAHAAELFAYAEARGVGLRLYPCVNPSGFEAHTRYNVGGERPNNDFLRYEIAPGVWPRELHAGESALAWRAHDAGPKETLALARELALGPVPTAA